MKFVQKLTNRYIYNTSSKIFISCSSQDTRSRDWILVFLSFPRFLLFLHDLVANTSISHWLLRNRISVSISAASTKVDRPPPSSGSRHKYSPSSAIIAANLTFTCTQCVLDKIDFDGSREETSAFFHFPPRSPVPDASHALPFLHSSSSLPAGIRESLALVRD